MKRPFALALLLSAALASAAEGERTSGAAATHSLGGYGLMAERGLFATASASQMWRLDCDGSFTHGAVHGGYMFRPWLRGSAEVSISGGVDDDRNTYAFTRYSVAADFAKISERWVLFAGPALSVNQGDDWIWETDEDLQRQASGCLELGEGSFGYGFEAGGAFRMGRFFELSLALRVEGNVPWSLLADARPAVAWELTQTWPGMREYVSAVWLYAGADFAWRRNGLDGAPAIGASAGF